MYNLGKCYEDGKGGLTKDTSKAVEWYQKAAEAGDEEGMDRLGDAYAYGDLGLPQNRRKAIEWHQKAAEVRSEIEIYSIERACELA